MAPSDLDAWKDFDAKNWLLFSNVSRLVIQGNGEIDGQGAAWWDRDSDGKPTVCYNHYSNSHLSVPVFMQECSYMLVLPMLQSYCIHMVIDRHWQFMTVTAFTFLD